MAFRYAEHSPSPRLAHLVACYWILEGDSEAPPQPILPDGRPELIFHLGSPFARHHVNGAVEIQPRAIVAGQIVQPVLLSPTGPSGAIGIRLKPAAAGAVWRMPAMELTGQLVPFDAIFTSSSLLVERLAEASTDCLKISVLEEWLWGNAFKTPRIEIRSAVDAILGRCGVTNIKSLSGIVGLSPRQLERAFRDEVGISAKTFARIVRLQRAVRLIGRGHSLAEIAVACGYYDQAHMALDFRQFAADTPRGRPQCRGELAMLFAGR
jgi:AraC-like DNA-binding protein